VLLGFICPGLPVRLSVSLIVPLIPLIPTLALPVLQLTSFLVLVVFFKQFPIAQFMFLALQIAKLALLGSTFQTPTLVRLSVSLIVPLTPLIPTLALPVLQLMFSLVTFVFFKQ